MKRSFVSVLFQRFAEKSPLIQLVVGPRQVGKTTGILQFLEEYDGKYRYQSADAVFGASHEWLIEQWQHTLLLGEGALLAIDEIQKIANWAEVIKKLWDERQVNGAKIKLLLSGSSSLSLQQGVTESLAGRAEIIHVPHWDYLESKELVGLSLDDYLLYGGYPKSYDFLPDVDRWRGYMNESVLDKVIDKDILQYARVKNPSLFRRAFELACCYPSQEISYTKLLGQLQDKGNVDLVKYYLRLFEGAFLLKTLQKYQRQDYKTRSSSPKILPLSPCFYMLFSANVEKLTFVFESTVGAKLLQVSRDIYYWREGQYEVDFVLIWRNRLIAIEVKSGKKRRAGGLTRFVEKFPEALPIIISRDNYEAFIADPISFFAMLL